MSIEESPVESGQRGSGRLKRSNRRGRGLQSAVPSTRTSVSWTFVSIALVALVVVLVFILENLHASDATFFGVHWRIPLGLDLLLAALLGATVVFVVGAARTLQLRLLARRTMRARDAHHTPPLTNDSDAGAASAPIDKEDTE